MRIIVDADSCPTKDIILEIAMKYNVAVVMYFDSSHDYINDYATVKIVEKGFDSVDFYIIKDVCSSDFVVTQDYGLAALCLTKNVVVIHPNGFEFTTNNIDELLNYRYLGHKSRLKNKHIKGPKKRSKEDDVNFYHLLEKLILARIDNYDH